MTLPKRTIFITAITVLAFTITPIAAMPVSAQSSETCTFPHERVDATGTTVEVPTDPNRIVTVNPSAAQTMWELNAEDEVVGVSQFATYLDGAAQKQNVSGPAGLSVELVLGANPDLVLVPNAASAPDKIGQIRDAGIPVYVFEEGTSLEFVAEKTELIGRLTGNCEAGQTRATEMRYDLAHIEQSTRNDGRPIGLHIFFGFTSGEETFINDIIQTSGVLNGAALRGITGFKPINQETIIDLNPEWITTPDDSDALTDSGYQNTEAGTRDKIIRINPNYISQPAPRAVRAVETITQSVHPDAYTQYQELQAENKPIISSTEIETSGDGTAVTPKGTVTMRVDALHPGISSVTIDASVLAAGPVTLSDTDDDGVYTADITVGEATTLTDGRYELPVTVTTTSETETTTTTAPIQVTTTPLTGVAGEYDADNDGEIGFNEVQAAITDFVVEETLTREEVQDVIRVFIV